MLPTSHRNRCRATKHCTCNCKYTMLRRSSPHPTAAQKIEWSGVPETRRKCRVAKSLETLWMLPTTGKPCQPTCVSCISGHRTSFRDPKKIQYSQCNLKYILDWRKGRARIIDHEFRVSKIFIDPCETKCLVGLLQVCEWVVLACMRCPFTGGTMDNVSQNHDLNIRIVQVNLFLSMQIYQARIGYIRVWLVPFRFGEVFDRL